MPDWFRELVEEVAFAGRASEYVKCRASGVSAHEHLPDGERNMKQHIIQGEKKVYPAWRACTPP